MIKTGSQVSFLITSYYWHVLNENWSIRMLKMMSDAPSNMGKHHFSLRQMLHVRKASNKQTI